MDGLRWLLLLFGLLVVVGVYLYSRRERYRMPFVPKARPSTRVEPSFDAGRPLPDLESEPPAAGAADDPDEGDSTGPREKIVALRLVARHHGAFAGDELALTLRGIGLRHGRFGIFHRYEGEGENQVIFSAASLVEPGSFDLANLKTQRIPGISLFMVLPGPLDGAQAYDLMVAAGRAMTKALNAELLDESGSTFSIQRERYIREEIIQYQHGIKVA